MENQPKEFYLTEYGKAKELTGWTAEKLSSFEAFLEEVWENRKHSGVLAEWYEAEDEPINQPLLQIKHERKGRQGLKFSVRATNYVGIIRFNNTTFHLIPKIIQGENEEETLERANAHLLWWLSYSKTLRLPKHITSLNYRQGNFLEILIHLFASYTLHELKQGVYQTYQEVEEETTYLKGQLVFNEYVSNYLGRANYQKMYCRYDSFEIDNPLNRIIKYVCKQLRSFTGLKETRQVLSQIIWTLDEVTDMHVSHSHCDKVVLNRMYSNYQMVLDYCKMFLLNSQTTTSKTEEDAFAFLLPMEKVFEEFVLGFIQKEVEGIEATGQYSKKYLTQENRVLLRPDLYLKNSKGDTFLADTKYKLLYDGFRIAPADLYQMTAYAIRHQTERIHLFYPDWDGVSQEFSELNIKDEFPKGGKVIKINTHALKIQRALESNDTKSLKLLFEPLKDGLKGQIRKALKVEA